MTAGPEDWDELFLRYLAGEADADLEGRVRKRLMSDESARSRLVALACQQPAGSEDWQGPQWSSVSSQDAGARFAQLWKIT